MVLLFEGFPVETGMLPLESEVTELVEFFPNFLNLLSVYIQLIIRYSFISNKNAMFILSTSNL